VIPWVWIYGPIEGVSDTLVEDLKPHERRSLVSKEVADRCVGALRTLEDPSAADDRREAALSFQPSPFEV
jgi:hypothetical protein